MNSRIGICTMYTNSCNYGGILQSYAMCRVLNENGYKAEQIRYVNSYKKTSICDKIRNVSLSKIHTYTKQKLSSIINEVRGKINGAQNQISVFRNAFTQFRDSIPHTHEIYNENTVWNCNNFDIYITGSDQVWNIGCTYTFIDFYWLGFVGKEKIKISYAASISNNSIPQSVYPQIKDFLSDYVAISVREKQDKELIDNIFKEDIAKWVLDPTFLVSANEWEQLCEKSPYKKNSYVFVYLLGENRLQRKSISKWAHDNNKKIVTIPYLLGKYRSCDKHFGDIRISNVTPNLWLSLIKNAECVFTDSFHATVFASIFHTPFFIFKRSNDLAKASMNSRIFSLTEMLGFDNRIINDAEYSISSRQLYDLDFDYSDKIIKQKRKESIAFLMSALEGER